MDYPKKGIWRHFKGGTYELMYIARHSETDEPMVVYRALYECGETPLGERVWVRPLSMWTESVTRNGRTFPRFTYVGDEAAPPPSDADAPPADASFGEAPAAFIADAEMQTSEPAIAEADEISAGARQDKDTERLDAHVCDVRGILSRVYGYADFRPGQEQAIQSILSGRDTLGVMPTGAGKSLCYQIPALALEGVTIVISPLISLMQDQVNALKQNGVNAAYINTSLTEAQISAALRNAQNGAYKLIYVAPERLATDRFLRACAHMNIALVAVDEAHCISQWGQDFRPSYLDIPGFIKSLPARPRVCAFTATATQKVRSDIKELLGLDEPFELVTGFDRPNLYFNVLRPANKLSKLSELMRTYADMSGIIYCATRRQTDEVCEYLNQNGVRCARYHAGMSEEERKSAQEAFSMDEIPVIAATNAFGMGIDKSNVRFVIHYSMPKDIESYYQEAGRAGRDGERADCVLMYSPQDLVTQSFFIDHIGEEAKLDARTLSTLKKSARQRLNAMKSYAVSGKCLRASLLKYFGEDAPESCGRCTVCDGRIKRADVTGHAQSVMQLVASSKRAFGAGTLVQALRGSKTENVLRLGLDKSPCYGALKQLSRTAVDSVVEAMTDAGVLAKTDGEYPVIKKGVNWQQAESGELRLYTAEETTAAKPKTRRAPTPVLTDSTPDARLFALLRDKRTELARSRSVPPFMIFADTSLISMTKLKPHTPEEFMRVNGVGEAKCRAYAESFISCVLKWEKEEKRL
ncbi:MAG: DNA helicase RecQ [Clostridia bacterium]|nr:DNA helicase RecQ [Clostridia bacterium]